MSTLIPRPPTAAHVHARTPHPTGAGALLRIARPKQWIKNVLVLAGPGAAGTLLDPSVAVTAVWAALAFTLASAGTYFINDAHDVLADRAHPRKALRPVASGAVSVGTAYLVGCLLAAGSLLTALPLGLPVVGVLALYLATTTAYSRWLKNQPVLDILVVAAGFVLRALAGAAATTTPLSNWFLLVALFGSLYVVTAKRMAERAQNLGEGITRPTVQHYPAAWMQQVLTVSMSGTVLAYATWALQYIGTDVSLPLLALSLVPFLAGMLRYSLMVALGSGEAPEDLITDRFLLLAGIVWAVMVGGAIYLA